MAARIAPGFGRCSRVAPATQGEIIRSGIKQPLPEGYEEAVVLQGEGDPRRRGTVGFRRGTSGTTWWWFSSTGPTGTSATSGRSSSRPSSSVPRCPGAQSQRSQPQAGPQTFESIPALKIQVMTSFSWHHTRRGSDTYLRGYSGVERRGPPSRTRTCMVRPSGCPNRPCGIPTLGPIRSTTPHRYRSVPSSE